MDEEFSKINRNAQYNDLIKTISNTESVIRLSVRSEIEAHIVDEFNKDAPVYSAMALKHKPEAIKKSKHKPKRSIPKAGGYMGQNFKQYKLEPPQQTLDHNNF